MARIMASLTDVHAKGKILALFLKTDYFGHKAYMGNSLSYLDSL